ncbi:MAG: hypothetical protein R3229_05240 [Alphaproteobacteria bacterium]|nr:hypothetical protein [Alphaproteobacteria bacterium]
MADRRTWAALGAALLLTSCAETPEPPAGPAVEVTTESRQEHPPATGPTENDGFPADRGIDLANPSPPSGKPAATPTPRPRVSTALLMGLGDDQLLDLLGPPRFRRIDDPAALWQYRGTGCILDVFLYADGPIYRVKHLKFRHGNGAGGGRSGNTLSGVIEGRAAEACLSGLAGIGEKG